MRTCVEVEKNDDGSFTVSECEPKAEAMAGEENAEPSGQTVKTIDEALMAAKSLLTGTDSQAMDMQAGFNEGGM